MFSVFEAAGGIGVGAAAIVGLARTMSDIKTALTKNGKVDSSAGIDVMVAELRELSDYMQTDYSELQELAVLHLANIEGILGQLPIILQKLHAIRMDFDEEITESQTEVFNEYWEKIIEYNAEQIKTLRQERMARIAEMKSEKKEVSPLSIMESISLGIFSNTEKLIRAELSKFDSIDANIVNNNKELKQYQNILTKIGAEIRYLSANDEKFSSANAEHLINMIKTSKEMQKSLVESSQSDTVLASVLKNKNLLTIDYRSYLSDQLAQRKMTLNDVSKMYNKALKGVSPETRTSLRDFIGRGLTSALGVGPLYDIAKHLTGDFSSLMSKQVEISKDTVDALNAPEEKPEENIADALNESVTQSTQEVASTIAEGMASQQNAADTAYKVWLDELKSGNVRTLDELVRIREVLEEQSKGSTPAKNEEEIYERVAGAIKEINMLRGEDQSYEVVADAITKLTVFVNEEMVKVQNQKLDAIANSSAEIVDTQEKLNAIVTESIVKAEDQSEEQREILSQIHDTNDDIRKENEWMNSWFRSDEYLEGIAAVKARSRGGGSGGVVDSIAHLSLAGLITSVIKKIAATSIVSTAISALGGLATQVLLPVAVGALIGAGTAKVGQMIADWVMTNQDLKDAEKRAKEMEAQQRMFERTTIADKMTEELGKPQEERTVTNEVKARIAQEQERANKLQEKQAAIAKEYVEANAEINKNYGFNMAMVKAMFGQDKREDLQTQAEINAETIAQSQSQIKTLITTLESVEKSRFIYDNEQAPQQPPVNMQPVVNEINSLNKKTDALNNTIAQTVKKNNTVYYPLSNKVPAKDLNLGVGGMGG